METETGIEVNIDWEALSNSRDWLLLRAFIVDVQKEIYKLVLCQDNGHIKPLFFSKISKMHKLVAFIPRFA